MKIQVKRPLSFEGIDYRPGMAHELPDHLAKNWFFLAHVQNGNITVVKAAGKLLDQIHDAPAASVPQAGAVEVEAPKAVEDEEEQIEDEEELEESDDDLGLGDELEESEEPAKAKAAPKKKSGKKSKKKKG